MRTIKPTGKSGIVSVEEAMQRAQDYVKPEVPKTEIPSDYFVSLKNINCYDHVGGIFQDCEELLVTREFLELDTRGRTQFSLYDAIKTTEDANCFLPSFALTCNILVDMHVRGENWFVEQYEEHHPCAQNTLIDWAAGEIKHYPAVIQKDKGTVNAYVGSSLHDFDETEEWNREFQVADALNESIFVNFFKNLTGLNAPEQLVNLSRVFGHDLILRLPEFYDEPTMPVFRQGVIDCRFKPERKFIARAASRPRDDISLEEAIQKAREK